LAATVDDATLKAYFEQYGVVEDAVVMYDHENRRPRGFGFITFAEEEAVEKVFQLGTIQVINEKQIEIKRAVPRESISHSPRTMFRPQQSVHESRFQQGTVYSRRLDRDREADRGSSPRPGLSVGGHPDSVAVRSKVLPQQHDVYSPPTIVTGIPAGMAVPSSTPMALGTAALGQMGSLGGGGMIGVPQGNVVIANTALRNQSQYHPSNYQSNGMQGGPSHLSVMSTPPFRLDEQGMATSNFAELHQQMALNSVNEALEHLHVHQTQQTQQRVQQTAQQSHPPQAQTTIWS
jgi:hypothetical protein